MYRELSIPSAIFLLLPSIASSHSSRVHAQMSVDGNNITTQNNVNGLVFHGYYFSYNLWLEIFSTFFPLLRLDLVRTQFRSILRSRKREKEEFFVCTNKRTIHSTIFWIYRPKLCVDVPKNSMGLWNLNFIVCVYISALSCWPKCKIRLKIH
jgi:hypothetical protein